MTDRPISKEFDTIIGDVSAYYQERLAEHGATARGVDWNGPESQHLRFEQLARVVSDTTSFSVTDVGCGYGALFDFLNERFEQFSYLGIDISPDMLEAARHRLQGHPNARFASAADKHDTADYNLASGIFNVRLGHDDEAWKTYLVSTLDDISQNSRRGFAFNCLTSYSDQDRMQKHLYYADPCTIFDLCKRRYSRNVALLHDYGLYEFTIIVRKDL